MGVPLLHVKACRVMVCFCASCFVLFPVSEAPKEAPVRKYLPSSVYLEEKTDEQKKEEVRGHGMTAPLCLVLVK